MKNKIFYVLVLAFLVFVSFYYGGFIKQNVLRVNDLVIESFYDFKDYLVNKISQHFNQIEQIQKLKERNKELEDIAVKVAGFANQLNKILEDQNSTKYLPQLSLTRAISYVKLNDYKRVWLDKAKIPPKKNSGLIYQGYTAGIAINKNDRAMALLQGDEQCVFSVYIGKIKAPGLVQGQDNKIFVKYIPKWAKINLNDEILTSGLDNIFFAGVPVGVVSKIYDDDMYQSVEIKPYVYVDIPDYLYVIDSL